MQSEQNIDPAEVEKFSAMSLNWWDEHGQCKPLHGMNPTRLGFITDQTDLRGKQVLDIGCGGGILSEALAQKDAIVTGIDASDDMINIAKLHAKQSHLTIDYQVSSAEEFANHHANQFDVITCMELLEHVPSPESLLYAIHTLLKPGGHCFLSTLNRTPKAYLFAIIGAEYIARLLPRGTHRYQQFIKPAELANSLRDAHLSVKKTQGMRYNPFNNTATLCQDVGINYLIYTQK